MKLEKQMLITLTDNEEYVVLDTMNYKNVSYVYLVGHTNLQKMKFCIEELENEQIKLIEVDDIALRQKLLLLFTEKLKKENE